MSRWSVFRRRPSAGARSSGWYALNDKTGIGVFTTGQLAWAKALAFTDTQDRQDRDDD